jgi:NAD(P)-dependent dehydrogenase (short-subunit alcohol dehydrogenase family)
VTAPGGDGAITRLPGVAELFGLPGRVALVTGAGRGIGAAVAAGLAGAGAMVALVDLDGAAAATRAREIEAAGGRAVAFAADVADAAAVDRAVDALVERAGRLDVLVNNAGVVRGRGALETSEEDWEAVMRVNVRGVFLCARRGAAEMRRQGGGAIVNVASTSSFRATRVTPLAAYDASKAAVANLTRALAVEWAPHGIRVNAIAPGPLATAMTIPLSPEQEARKLAPIPMGRRGSPAEMVGAVLFLASPAAAYVTGQVLPVDGGLTA